MTNYLVTAHDMNSDDFPEHVRPNQSCLESHRPAIALARKKKWPYHAIATLLLERHGLTIHPRTIGKFCDRRRIVKGKGETQVDQPATSARRSSHSSNQPTPAEKSAFDFDESLPMETWKTRTGSRPE